MGMPLWLDADGHSHDAIWDSARTEFLYRLNERRASLVQEHARPVVLALPLDWTKRAAEAAPDLWTIRQPSIYLESPATPQPVLGSDTAEILTLQSHQQENDPVAAASVPLQAAQAVFRRLALAMPHDARYAATLPTIDSLLAG